MKPIEKRTRERLENNLKVRLFKSVLWNIKEVELKIFLKDILEHDVEEKYFLSEKATERFIFNDKKLPQGEAYKILGTTQNPNAKGTNSRHWIYDTNTCAGSLNATMYKQPLQIIRLRTNTKKGYDESPIGDEIRLRQQGSKTGRERIIKQVSGSLQCNDLRGTIREKYRLSKLTPKECFRLMGFLNDEINLEGLSDTQKYKLAGNGQDVNMVSLIFKQMFREDLKENKK